MSWKKKFVRNWGQLGMKCKLEDIVDVTMGQSPKSEYYNTEGKGYLFLQGNRTFGFKYPTFDTYTTVMTKPAKAGDVIMSVRAPVGDLNITPVDMCLGRGVCSLRMKNGNQDFLFYMMKYYIPHLLKKESGTVFGSVNRNDINGLEVNIPENAQVQKKIARYLEMIDDKIELNNAVNNNLEQQAQAVYYKMFSEVNTVPVELSSIIDVRDGTHDSPKAQATGYYLITSKHLLPFGVDKASANHISKADFDKINERSLVETQDILMSMIGTIGLISYIPYETVDFAIKNVALFKTSHTPELAYYFLCYLKSEKTLQHIGKCLAGSTQKYISLGELRKMPIYSPTTNEIREFNCLVKPMFEKIVSRTYENALLAEMRDSLLPKLMSGELDVSKIDI